MLREWVLVLPLRRRVSSTPCLRRKRSFLFFFTFLKVIALVDLRDTRSSSDRCLLSLSTSCFCVTYQVQHGFRLHMLCALASKDSLLVFSVICMVLDFIYLEIIIVSNFVSASTAEE